MYYSKGERARMIVEVLIQQAERTNRPERSLSDLSNKVTTKLIIFYPIVFRLVSTIKILLIEPVRNSHRTGRVPVMGVTKSAPHLPDCFLRN